MRNFKRILYFLASIPLITGLLNLGMGIKAQQLIGVQLSPEAFNEPLLNSQMRFYGAIWFGFGVLLCICLSDVTKYRALLRGALAVVFLGGIGRLISQQQFGSPTTTLGRYFVVAVILIEIVGMPLLLWWHSRIEARAGAAAEG